MKTKKKNVEQEKNRNSQKSVKSVRLMGVGVYGGKDFWKRYVFSDMSLSDLEWPSEHPYMLFHTAFKNQIHWHYRPILSVTKM